MAWFASTSLLALALGLILWGTKTINLLVILVVAITVAALGFATAIATPTSDWSFLAPYWLGALAPVAAILGLGNPVNPSLNPFTGPVPFPGPYLVVFQGWNGHITL
eukprot:CAMPEP_0170199840 /NCGR_PEP_ID=MMETSP0040_2-20121228/69553_1 /TAXON_ID=641309 /ORGANISM="Lotharella oceanica, Strain CCMP622" /LENGTH=106 /DNA_ID=CAMNT_0010449991 /DNA_START=818 /DNA_END=1138 /DNA_ORIENTATION=-